MYAVVYKNRVLVGPMNWNRAIFQGSLEKQKITVTLPRVAPEQLPYTVNEDASIMMVEEIRPEINPLVEYHYGPLWEITDTKVFANYEVCNTQIEFARVNLKNQAAEERWKKEVAGTTINIQDTDVSIDTNRESRNAFVQKQSTIQEGQTVNWKFIEGWLSLSKTDLDQIVFGIDTYIQSCFDWEKTINDQIDAAETKEELLAIEIVEKQEEEQPIVE
jgi:hypothetical protein